MERLAGVEPASLDWRSSTQPICQRRKMVAGPGVEPGCEAYETSK